MNKAIVIGVAGGTGSGKTTLSKRIKDVFKDEVIILSHDYYYKSNDHLAFEERAKLNFDHPNAFETDLMIEDLKKLKNGQPIEHPVYDFVHHTRMAEKVLVIPKKVIILEGILIFENLELCSLMDIKVFVDTDADVRIIRRLLRDVKDRGRDIDSVINQYLSTVKPMHEQFVEPSKKNVDIIIPEGGFNHVAIKMLIGQIKSFLQE